MKRLRRFDLPSADLYQGVYLAIVHTEFQSVQNLVSWRLQKRDMFNSTLSSYHS